LQNKDTGRKHYLTAKNHRFNNNRNF